jgi:Family of unknown function (DUF5681)
MFDAVNKSGKQRGRPFRPGASGNPKGRPRGSLNKRTRTLLEAAKAGGEMPLDFLLRLMRDSHSPMARRLEAAKAAAPFLHPKLSAIDAKLSSVAGDPSAEIDKIRIEFVLPSEGDIGDGQE